MRPNQRRAAAHFSKRRPALILLWEWSKIWWLSISHGQSFKHYSSYAQASWSSTWWIKKCSAPLRSCWVKGHVLILHKLLGLVTGMKDFQCLSWRECMHKKLRPTPAGRGQVKPSQSLNKTFFKWSACLHAEQSLNQDWAAKGQGMWRHRYQVLSPTSVIYPGSVYPQAEPGFLANVSAEYPGQLWS